MNTPPKGTPPSGGNEAPGETGVARQAAEFAAAFGRLIQEERKRQGLRQDELAMVSGTGKRFIVDLEAGKSTCQLGRSLHVADVLGLRIEDVLKDAQARRANTSETPDIPDSDEEEPHGPSSGLL
ncbi:y4mF family transcriptional regulator [Bradyrhizobium sp. CIR18]|uniref:helix-turn-helix domain-containing protein n=1 Tax=Bradyrhizobium sp. CIR18 TaxID=2663839 RepID=UPI001606392D|nr:y4mF family transcriptional regulator [Bradyrhizobium sp. CIR18]